MFRRLATFVLAPLVTGALLVWACVSLVGWLAVIFIEHRYFGLPVQVALEVEDVLAWVPLCLCCGFLIGSLLHKSATATAFATALAGFLFLVFSVLDGVWDGSWGEAATVVGRLYTKPGIFMLFAVPGGALLAQRWKRSNKSAQHGRPAASAGLSR